MGIVEGVTPLSYGNQWLSEDSEGESDLRRISLTGIRDRMENIGSLSKAVHITHDMVSGTLSLAAAF